MRTVFYDDFSDAKRSMSIWSYKPPWGAVYEHHNCLYTAWDNVRFEDDGLHMFSSDNADDDAVANCACIYYKNNVLHDAWHNPVDEQLPFQYGRFTFDMTVPFGVHAAAWLLSQVRIRRGYRTILEEIDVAEFGLGNAQTRLNLALHRWRHDFEPEDNGDDYNGDKQRNKLIAWPTGRNKYTVELKKYGIFFYVNDKLRWWQPRPVHAYMTPLITITRPNWYVDQSRREEIVLHSVEIEQ